MQQGIAAYIDQVIDIVSYEGGPRKWSKRMEMVVLQKVKHLLGMIDVPTEKHYDSQEIDSS